MTAKSRLVRASDTRSQFLPCNLAPNVTARSPTGRGGVRYVWVGLCMRVV